ncbi:AMP-binding enzyme [Bradyrhizobium sp. DASA03068]|uniref:AMP-binding enzyme n=1 Tax=Bradyrhizobium sp. BLXBL-01 TaxID=3395915 RepID=UPI003F713D80
MHGAVAVASACAGVKLTARDIAGAEAQAESRRLVAYVSASAELAESDLQKFLAEALPTYMLPEIIILVSGIPLTRNGKVDFAALPDPASVRYCQRPSRSRNQTSKSGFVKSGPAFCVSRTSV